MTTHSLVEGDCRELRFVENASVNLIITHPPGFRCCEPGSVPGQLSAIADYDRYLAELDSVWAECERVLAPGGYLACVASPVAPREGDLPVSADIHHRARAFGFEAKTSIRWLQADAVEPDDADFIGQPNQPCREPLFHSQDLLILAKHGRRIVAGDVEARSRMSAAYYATCSSPVWLIPADPDPAHPQSFPIEMAARLIRMFSYAGDTVLDPFVGSGTTNLAAMAHGRSSIGVEIEPAHFHSLNARVGAASAARLESSEIVIKRLDEAPQATATAAAFVSRPAGESGANMEEPEKQDDRATDSPADNSDSEPTPGEDPGPMGNPAEDEEALRHEQEDASEGDG